MHCDLDLWSKEPEFNRANLQLKGSLFVKFQDVSCKGKAIVHQNIVAAFRGMHVSPAKHSSASVTDGRTDRRTDRQTDRRTDRQTTDKVIPMCRYASQATQKPFSTINALWPWPLDPKINRAHPQLMGNLCMKFHGERCKGKAIMGHKPFSVINALCPWRLTFWPQNL